MTNDSGKSDKPIVPLKDANKERGRPRSAERLEERGLAKGNSGGQTKFWTQGQVDLHDALDRIREVARRDRDERYTALWHHVYNVNRLRQAYFALKRTASPGVDNVTWHSYGETLEESLKDLSTRLKRGSYKARPVKRIYIPKPDGRQRPIGITALEDKIVQRATVEVLNAVYEEEFLGFSYGFRPGRSQHNALDAVTVGIEQRIMPSVELCRAELHGERITGFLVSMLGIIKGLSGKQELRHRGDSGLSRCLGARFWQSPFP